MSRVCGLRVCRRLAAVGYTGPDTVRCHRAGHVHRSRRDACSEPSSSPTRRRRRAAHPRRPSRSERHHRSRGLVSRPSTPRSTWDLRRRLHLSATCPAQAAL